MLGDEVFSSAPLLSETAIPAQLRDSTSADGEAVETTASGIRYRVVRLTAPRSGTELYFFFERTDLETSLRELARILLVGWVTVVAVAAAVGAFVARRTLRPVRSAADAAHAVAEGLLDTRLPVSGTDEFATLATAFNDMAEALQQKLAEVSAAHDRERRLTGDVAHELMTPLGALVAEASVVESHLDAFPPPARRMAELMVHDVRRLRRLVEELLELARVDAATAADHRERVRIGDVLASATARADDVEVRGDVDTRVTTNRGCLDRIVSNLVRNARDHGDGTVEVGVHRLDGRLDVVVRDHGPGIGAAHLPHVFERFYKADSARSGGGSGLGLAIAAEYARLIDAHLTAANHPSGGAVFTVSLPLDDLERPPTRH